ncbi:MAG: general secretion pathway protein GspK [Chrysiogenetes bacterium]|nr:general secretion pathway protein GspK [Chrysiogenetes bacterium]
MMRSLHKRSRRPRGVALLLAILIVALLSVALSDFLYRSRVDLDAARNFEDLQQARYAARAGVEAGSLFLTAVKANEWADALITLGVPNFGAGGFIAGADEFKKNQPQQELQGEVFNDDTPSLTGVDFAEAYYDIPHNDPDGFNNGYLQFISSLTGFNFFTDGEDDDSFGDNIDVEIRFIDESSRLNLNALYYCSPSSGCGDSNQFNVNLYYQIRQLFIDQIIRAREESESKFGAREKEREEADTDERDRDGSRFEDEVEVGDIDQIMCSILDWLDPDDTQASNDGCSEGAERDDYLRLDEPYEPRNGPMESVGELRLVNGVTADIYRAVAPFLTVYPQVPSGDCRARLETLRSSVNSEEQFKCFDDKVNLMAASDQVIKAWAVGGFNKENYVEPDLRTRDIKEFKEEVLTLLNCARLPQDVAEGSGCPAPAPGVAAAPDCWATSADIKRVLETNGIYAFQEVGDTPNVGAATTNLSCSGGNNQNNQAGNFGDANAQQNAINFRKLVGDYVTIEAIGKVGLLDEGVVMDDGAPATDGEDEEDEGGGLRTPIESRITATYYVDGSNQSAPKLKLLRWQEY